MLLHVQIKPDGNGTVYSGTPEELKKRFNALRRSWERVSYAPFDEIHHIEVMQAGSAYYLSIDGGGRFVLCKRGKYCDSYTGYSYIRFGDALNRLQKLIESEV